MFSRDSCLLVSLVALAWTASAQADTAKLIRTSQSGNWSAATTWEGGQVPAAGQSVLIRTGHLVRYDVKSEQVLRALHIAGILQFAHDQDTRLEVGLIKVQHGEKVDENGFDCTSHPKEEAATSATVVSGLTAPCLCCEGKPALLVGTAEQPIDAKYTALIRLHYIDGMDKESCPAIVCCGARMDFHGAAMNRTWVKLGATVPTPPRGQPTTVTEITLAEEVTGWKAGDRIIVTSTAINWANDHATGSYRANAASRKHQQYQAQTEERIIQSISGVKVTLDRPLQFGHRGHSDYRCEVANLSRNVIVESADPAGMRGHTMYHRMSAGSIHHAEFRHLGKEGVLGRYSLHFHLCGDTMRGSSVVGNSIWDSGNRWLTIHGTHYLVVRDNVGYQSAGHGFFLEDGTEVYNVLDRNLAVQAFRSKKLPNQVLPFDKNEGAGFWWANSLNSFTRNVAVECDQYGFRFEATPKQGVDLTMPIRQPDGSRTLADIRTLPFVRFDGNEIHSMNNYGLNLGEGNGMVGPEAKHPFIIRDLKIWLVRLGYRPNVPSVRIDRALLINNTYGIYQPEYVAHDYRDFTWAGLDDGQVRMRRMPGNPLVGDGGGKPHPPELEVAKLEPVDVLPPLTVITDVRKNADGKLRVRGTVSDNGVVKHVRINGVTAKPDQYGDWEVLLDATTGIVKLVAHAEDEAGNVEKTAHELSVVIR